jgi:hypothetical protein
MLFHTNPEQLRARSSYLNRVPITFRRSLINLISLALSLYLVGSVASAVFLAEITLHVNHGPLRHRSDIEKVMFEEFRTPLLDVHIQAGDGAQLKAWYIHPGDSNGASVILFHGVNDNREGVAGYGGMFLHDGYSVLLPDSRAHGESGGDIATYGIRERQDVHLWPTGCSSVHLDACTCLVSQWGQPSHCKRAR